MLASSLRPFALVSMLGFLAVVPASATTEDTKPQTRSNPVIVTPEAVKADFHSGGVGYTYKIELPPAGGIVPELALSFSSLTGNTEYGRGWALNLSKIERSTRTGPPTYQAPASGADTFELDGALLAQDPDNLNRFHLEQTDHRRILYVPGAGNDYWEVTFPDGTQYLYGSRGGANSTLDNAGRQPEVQLARFRWSLDKVIDPRGNWYEIDYAYETFDHPQPPDANGDPSPPITYKMNNHPAAIRYSYHDAEPGPRERRLVLFEWGMRGEADYNDDRPTSYRSGFKVQISKRLTDIFVGIDTDGDGELGEGERVRRYELLYNPKPFWGDPTSETLPPFSQLAAIQRYGKTDEDVFPTRTDFTYTRPPRGITGSETHWEHPANTNGVDFTRVDYVPPGWMDYTSMVSTLKDMNGDGFVDFVYWDTDNQNMWVAYGPVVEGGQFADEATDWGFTEPVLWDTPPPLNGGGVKKVVKAGPPPFTEDWTWTDLIDMDGDGLPDWVSIGGDVALNLGNGSFAAWEDWGVGWVEHREPPPACTAEGWPCPGLFGEITRTLVDVNGDGRPDTVDGYDDFEQYGDPNQVWAITPGPGPGSTGFDYKRVPLNDFGGGDYINDLGMAWQDPNGLTYIDAMFADANGDGLADAWGIETCLGAARQAFSLGDGWQTMSRTGQGFHDDAVSAAPEDLYCDSATTSALEPLWPEAVDGNRGTVIALLDLNGDGINDLYHY